MEDCLSVLFRMNKYMLWDKEFMKVLRGCEKIKDIKEDFEKQMEGISPGISENRKEDGTT